MLGCIVVILAVVNSIFLVGISVVAGLLSSLSMPLVVELM